MLNINQNMKTLKSALVLLLFTVTTFSYSQPTDNVVAYYPFNGNANDVTVNGKNATVTGATLTTDRLGNINAAYLFNGSSNYMVLPTTVLPGSSAFSISCWIKPVGDHATTDVGQVFIDLRAQYQIALNYFQSNSSTPNSIQFYVYSNPTVTAVVSSNNSIQVNNWYHIVATFGYNTMTLYLNGALVGTQTSNAPSACSGVSNTIGKDYNIYLNRGWFNGPIDEVLFYKRTLTAAEALALYNRGLASSNIPELFAPFALQYSYNTSGERISRTIQKVLLKSANNYIRDSALFNQTINDQNESYEDNVDGKKVIIYPNPTQGQLKIEIQGYEQTSAIVYLYDLSGKLLINKKQFDSSIPLDLSSFTNGTYILKIVMGDKTSEWKILKE